MDVVCISSVIYLSTYNLLIIAPRSHVSIVVYGVAIFGVEITLWQRADFVTRTRLDVTHAERNAFGCNARGAKRGIL